MTCQHSPLVSSDSVAGLTQKLETVETLREMTTKETKMKHHNDKRSAVGRHRDGKSAQNYRDKTG